MLLALERTRKNSIAMKMVFLQSKIIYLIILSGRIEYSVEKRVSSAGNDLEKKNHLY